MVNEITGTLHLTEDELTFLLELINNERYTANTNIALAEALAVRVSRDLDNVRMSIEEDAEAFVAWDAVSK
jgi:hypothetical protein